MYLSQLKDDQTARIISISGGTKLHQRLALRGITEGLNFKVISSKGPGPVTIKSNGNLITVGRGMAKKIRVREIDKC